MLDHEGLVMTVGLELGNDGWRNACCCGVVRQWIGLSGFSVMANWLVIKGAGNPPHAHRGGNGLQNLIPSPKAS